MGASTIPFCKSITMSAGLGSKVVSAIVSLFPVGIAVTGSAPAAQSGARPPSAVEAQQG